MVTKFPSHLLNQQITVISGGIGFDEFGMETYSESVVSSGVARLQFEDVREVTEGQVITFTAATAYIAPTVTGVVGQSVEIDSQKFKINSLRTMVDGRGITRLKVLNLSEADE